jgi:hypothetical protein
MARYIDADVLKEAIQYYHSHTGDQSTNAEHYAYGVALKEIDRIPAADVVEVVRCRHCVYWENGKDYTPYCNNLDGLNEPDADDFCSYGERSEQ